MACQRTVRYRTRAPPDPATLQAPARPLAQPQPQAPAQEQACSPAPADSPAAASAKAHPAQEAPARLPCPPEFHTAASRAASEPAWQPLTGRPATVQPPAAVPPPAAAQPPAALQAGPSSRDPRQRTSWRAPPAASPQAGAATPPPGPWQASARPSPTPAALTPADAPAAPPDTALGAGVADPRPPGQPCRPLASLQPSVQPARARLSTAAARHLKLGKRLWSRAAQGWARGYTASHHPGRARYFVNPHMRVRGHCTAAGRWAAPAGCASVHPLPIMTSAGVGLP